MKTETISLKQFAVFVIFFCIGSSILLLPGTLTQYVKQDAWLVALIGTIVTILLVALFNKIMYAYPGKNIVEISQTIFGMWLGGALALSLSLFSIFASGLLLYDVGNFLSLQILPGTPIEIIHIIFLLLVLYGVRLGIEALGRSAEILLFFFFLLFTIFVLSLLPNIEIKHIQPIFNTNARMLLRGALLYLSYFTFPLIVLLTIYPVMLNKPKKGRKYFYLSILIASVCLEIVILLTVLVFDPTVSSRQMYPSYALAKVINIGSFFQRVEVIMAGMWFITLYFKFVLYFYAAIKSIAVIFKLSDYRIISFPVAMFLYFFSLKIYSNTVVEGKFSTEIWPLYGLTYGIGFPLVMVIGKYGKGIILSKMKRNS